MSQNHIAGRVSGPIGIQLRWLLSERYGDGIVLEIDGVAGGRAAGLAGQNRQQVDHQGQTGHGVNGEFGELSTR